MKKSKKVLAIVLAVVICFSSLLVFAYANDRVYFQLLRSDSDDTAYGTLFYDKDKAALHVYLKNVDGDNAVFDGALAEELPQDVVQGINNIIIHGYCVEIRNAFNDISKIFTVTFDCDVVYDIDNSFNNCDNLRKIDFQASIGDGEWDFGSVNNSFNNLCEFGVCWIGSQNPCKLNQVTDCFKNTEIAFFEEKYEVNNLTVKNGKNGVDFSWNDVHHYGVEIWNRIPKEGFVYPGNIYVNHYTDKNVESGKTYQYDTDFGKLTITYLSRPVVTSCVSTSSNKATIKWQKVEGAKGYYVYQSTTGKSGSWKKIGNLSADKLSCTATGLKTNTKYYFCVKAYSGKDVSYGTTKTVTVGVPTILSAKKSGENITLKWAQQSNTVYYRIYAKSPGDYAYTRVATIKNPKTTSYTFKQFSENGTQIKVRAFYTSNGKTTYATTPLYTVK